MATPDSTNEYPVVLSSENNSEKSRNSSVTPTAPTADIQLSADSQPTEGGLGRLRRIPGKIPWAAYTITILEMFERLSFNGTFVVFINYIQQPLPPGSTTGAGHEGQSGALNMGQRASTGISLSKSFVLCSTPLLGAIVADQYLGRYKTIQWSNVFTLLGHVVLIVAALPSVIAHPQAALGIFVFGIVSLGIGFGGLKPNLATLLVEQIPDTECRVTVDKKGRRVIIDPTATISRVLLYFYLLVNIGSIIGMTTMAYAEKYVGFWLSFTIPTVVFLICPLILFWCRKRYISVPPSGSVLGNMTRLCALSMKQQWSWSPVRMYRRIQHPDFWARVKPSNIADRPSWMTFDDSWVDEVRRGLRACRVFCWYPLYWPALRQMHSNMTSQAATLSLGGLPNDVLINLDPLFCILLVPVYAHILYPTIDRLGFSFTPIKRISTGFFVSTLAMIIAALIQHSIYTNNPCGSHANQCIHRPPTAHSAAAETNLTSKLSVWVQLPVYFLLANSELLCLTTAQEYAFTQAPTNMRSLVMAVFYFSGAGGSAVAQILVPLSEDPLLVWNYVGAAMLSLVASVGVWWCNRGCDGSGGEKEMRGVRC